MIRFVKKRSGFVVVRDELASKRENEGQCPACGKPKVEWTRRTDWRCCSTECTEKYWKELVIYYGWGDLREKVLKRDQYCCVNCGHQPTAVRYRSLDSGLDTYSDDVVIETGTFEQEGHKYNMIKVVDKSKLTADHIHPIALGGDEWDIDNIQTLCENCNRIKTAKDIGKIAQLRRKEKLELKGQKFLTN